MEDNMASSIMALALGFTATKCWGLAISRAIWQQPFFCCCCYPLYAMHAVLVIQKIIISRNFTPSERFGMTSSLSLSVWLHTSSQLSSIEPVIAIIPPTLQLRGEEGQGGWAACPRAWSKAREQTMDFNFAYLQNLFVPWALFCQFSCV